MPRNMKALSPEVFMMRNRKTLFPERLYQDVDEILDYLAHGSLHYEAVEAVRKSSMTREEI